VSGHTPGPWRAYSWGKEYPEHYDISDREQHMAFAGVRDNHFRPELTPEVCAANARLIAAAPEAADLLDECEKFCPVDLQDKIRAWRKRVG